MKTFVVLSLLVALVADVRSYDTRHDNIDVDSVVANEEELRSYLDCFTGKNPCNDVTQHFKDKMPEIIQEACAKCNPIQKMKLKVLIQGLNEKLPVEFGDFKKSVDPEGKLFPALEAGLAKA